MKTEPQPSNKDMIDAKCVHCTYWPDNGGTWREQIEACSVTDCPLWPGRPTTARYRTTGPITLHNLALKRRSTADPT